MDQGATLLTASHIRRVGRSAMYAGLFLTGIVFSFTPSDVISDELAPVAVICWSAAMAATALVCFVGSVSGRWIGEYSGIPLLAATLAVYSVATLSQADEDSLARVAYAILLMSFASGLFARWRDVQRIRKVSMEGTTGERRG